MAPITVKKKSKLTFKTEASPETAVGEDEAAAAEGASGAPVITRYSQPEGASYTFAGVCALITLAIFLAILVLQFIEFDFYKDAFPMEMGVGMVAPSSSTTESAAPAVTPAPAAAPASEAAPAAVAEPAATPAGGTPPAAAPAEGGNARSKVEGRNATVNAEVEK